MAILSLPASPRFKAGDFRLLTNVFQHRSAADGSTQTVEKAGAHWALEAVLPPMTRAVAAPWLAFLASLDGPAGRFYAGDPFVTTPLGSVPGTPLINGASQTGNSVITDGWTATQSNILKEGDLVAWDLPSGGRSLHMITADVNSDGGGNATLTIHPPLRESPATNATVITASPTCVMRLTDNDATHWEIDAAGIFRASFSAIESFNTGS